MPLTKYSSFLSKKVYKTHIAKWGLDKNNKDCDMRAIAHKYSQRVQKGKASHFLVRRQAVDFAEVVRYWHRRNKSINDIVAERAASKTPEAVKCYTPLLSPVQTPEALALPEQLFKTLQDYHNGCFEAGIWVGDDEKSYCRTKKGHSDPYSSISRLRARCFLALDLFHRFRFQEAGAVLIAATASIKEIILGEHPHTLLNLCEVFHQFQIVGRPEVSLAILRQFLAMAQIILPEWHPLRLIFERLASATHLNSRDLALPSCQVLCEVFTRVIGPIHRTTIDTRRKILYLNTYYTSSFQTTSYQALIHECETALGPHDVRTLDVRLTLASECLKQGNFSEAKEMAETIITQINSNSVRCRGHDVLAMAQNSLGETWEAEASLRKAIDLGRSIWGDNDSNVLRWMFRLDGWLEARGDFEGAAQVHRERLALLEPILMELEE